MADSKIKTAVKRMYAGFKCFSRINSINDVVKYVQEQKPERIEVSAHMDSWGLEEFRCEYYARFLCYHPEEGVKPAKFQKSYGNHVSKIPELNASLDSDIQKIIDETGIAVDKKSEFK